MRASSAAGLGARASGRMFVGAEAGPAPTEARRLATRHAAAFAAICAGALGVKLLLILHLDGRVYGDVVRAVDFGLGLREGVISVRTHVDNTKTFVGPLLWSHLYGLGGVTALKAFNALAFLLLLVVQERFGRRLFRPEVVLVAVFLLAFYVGTNRNVAAGEPDDMAAALLVAAGLWAHARGGRVLAPSVLMGAAFLFKFWAALFIAGFAAHLLAARRPAEAARTAVGAALPFLAVNLVDGFASLRSLLMSLDRQVAYSSWATIGFRLLSTGALPAFVLACAAWLRDRTSRNRLLLLVPVPYFAYILLARDAHAVSFVMMLCLFTWSFPIAALLLRRLGAADRRPDAPGRRRALAALLGAYLLAGAAVSHHNLFRDSHELRPRPGRDAKPLDAGAPGGGPAAGVDR